MKKILKIILIIILVLIIAVTGYYAYLKIQIKKEEKRLEKEKAELMQLDTDFKYKVRDIRTYPDYEFYEIDFENKVVKEKLECNYLSDCEARYGINKIKHKLYAARGTNYGKLISEKRLSDIEAKELKQLLDDIMEDRVERRNDINMVIMDLSYEIETKDKTTVFDNQDLINKFLNLVK